MNPTTPTNVAELLAAGKASAPVLNVPQGYAPAVVVPEGYKVEPLQRSTLPPLEDHIRQKVILQDEVSFIAYVTRFKTAQSVVFVSPVDLETKSAPKYLAVLDYHHDPAQALGEQAARCAHRVTFVPKYSHEFYQWLTQSGRAMAQMEFVDFIERLSLTVIAPTSAEVLEMALNFEQAAEVKFQSKIDRTRGGRQLQYQETVQGGGSGSLKVPETLTIEVPVFEGEGVVGIEARMEYKVRDGRLTITYHLRNIEDRLREVVSMQNERIAAQTGIEPLTGTLE